MADRSKAHLKSPRQIPAPYVLGRVVQVATRPRRTAVVAKPHIVSIQHLQASTRENSVCEETVKGQT